MIVDTNKLNFERVRFTLLIEYQENSKTILKIVKINNMDPNNFEQTKPILMSEYEKSTPACQQSKDFSMWRDNANVTFDGSHITYKDLTLDKVIALHSSSTQIVSEHNL